MARTKTKPNAGSAERTSPPKSGGIRIEKVDHIGIRVADVKRAMAFYRLLGFELVRAVDHDAVMIIKNPAMVEINLIYNANDTRGGKNVLMDVPKKYPGYTHVALRVGSIRDTLAALKAHRIKITQGPVSFGDGHVSVFVRDPDRNVIELRGRAQDEDAIEGVTFYTPD